MEDAELLELACGLQEAFGLEKETLFGGKRLFCGFFFWKKWKNDGKWGKKKKLGLSGCFFCGLR